MILLDYGDVIAFADTVISQLYQHVEGSEVAEWVTALTGDRTVNGSSPAAVKKTFSELWQFRSPRFVICQCLSDETLKAVGPFYLVSMPGEVKDPTSPHWNA